MRRNARLILQIGNYIFLLKLQIIIKKKKKYNDTKKRLFSLSRCIRKFPRKIIPENSRWLQSFASSEDTKYFGVCIYIQTTVRIRGLCELFREIARCAQMYVCI